MIKPDQSLNRFAKAWVLAVIALVLLGCEDRTGGSGGYTQNTKDAEDEENPNRVVSLAPALTQMLVDMGYGSWLVGVAEHDLAAPGELPVVGNYQNINTERLMALKPTLVLAMSTQDSGTDRLNQLAKQYRFNLVSYPSPNNVLEIGNILFNPEEFLPSGFSAPRPSSAPRGPSVISLGKLVSDPDAALKVYVRLNTQLNTLREITFDAYSPRVLMVLSTNPVVASGPDTVLSQLLSAAGGENALPDGSGQSPTLDRERILALRPDVVMIIEPGGLDLRDWDRDSRIMPFRGLDIPAVQNRKVVLINHPLAMLPSSSVGLIAAEMARALHPGLAGAIDQAMVDSQSQPKASDQPKGSKTMPDSGEHPDPAGHDTQASPDSPPQTPSESPSTTPAAEMIPEPAVKPPVTKPAD